MQVIKVAYLVTSLFLLKIAQASVIPADINSIEPTTLQRLTQLISLDENGRRDFRANLMAVNKLVNEQLTDLEFTSQSTLSTLKSKSLLNVLSKSNNEHLKTILIRYDSDNCHVTFGELLQTSQYLSEISDCHIACSGLSGYNGTREITALMKVLKRQPAQDHNADNNLKNSINKLEENFRNPLLLTSLKIHLIKIAFDEIQKNSVRDSTVGTEPSHDEPPYAKVINLVANLNKNEISLFTDQLKIMLAKLTDALGHDMTRSKRSQREAQAWYGPTLCTKILTGLDLRPDDYHGIRNATLIPGPQSLNFITFMRFCQTLYQGHKSERIESGNILLGRNDCYPVTEKILNDLNLPVRAQYESNVRHKVAKLATFFGDPLNMDPLQLILIQKQYEELKQAAQLAQHAKSPQEIMYNFVSGNRVYFAFTGFAFLSLVNFVNYIHTV